MMTPVLLEDAGEAEVGNPNDDEDDDDGEERGEDIRQPAVLPIALAQRLDGEFRRQLAKTQGRINHAR